MIFCFLVACLASLTAASTASEPEFQKKERVETLVRHERQQLFDQLQVLLVICNVDLSMDDGGDLFLRGLCDSRMAMTEVDDSNAAREVEEASARDHGHIAAFS